MLIVGLLAALGLAACTSDAGSSPSSTPTSSAAQTSGVATTSSAPPSTTAPKSPTIATTGPNVRPGEKPPKEPALARSNSRQGAAEFAYYFFEALDWGYATTDSALAKSLFLPQCKTCALFTSDVDRVRAKRQHFRDGRIALKSRRIVSDDDRHPGATVVDVVFDAHAVSVVSRDGTAVRRGPAASNVRWRLWLEFSRASWSVLDLKRVIG